MLQELTSIRKSPSAFHEKAQRFVKVLQRAGAEDIQLMSCDVCENEESLGQEVFVRVQAQTELGYLTFCFFCDSIMCMNEVEYQDNPNWDILQKEQAVEYLRLHPEWNLKGFCLSGSTRRRICIDVLIPAGQEGPGFLSDEIEDFSVSVSFISEGHVIFSQEPGMLEMYGPLQEDL